MLLQTSNKSFLRNFSKKHNVFLFKTTYFTDSTDFILLFHYLLQTSYKALKLKKYSLKNFLALEFNFFMKKIAVHHKL